MRINNGDNMAGASMTVEVASAFSLCAGTSKFSGASQKMYDGLDFVLVWVRARGVDGCVLFGDDGIGEPATCLISSMTERVRRRMACERGEDGD